MDEVRSDIQGEAQREARSGPPALGAYMPPRAGRPRVAADAVHAAVCLNRGLNAVLRAYAGRYQFARTFRAAMAEYLAGQPAREQVKADTLAAAMLGAGGMAMAVRVNRPVLAAIDALAKTAERPRSWVVNAALVRFITARMRAGNVEIERAA